MSARLVHASDRDDAPPSLHVRIVLESLPNTPRSAGSLHLTIATEGGTQHVLALPATFQGGCVASMSLSEALWLAQALAGDAQFARTI